MNRWSALASCFFASWFLTIGPANAVSVIQDGTFLNPVGTSGILTPWSDFTSVGVTRNAAPNGIPGNYASLPINGDLYQQFAGPNLGTYILTFYAENQSPWAAQLFVGYHQPGGGGWIDLGTFVSLPASSGFIEETLTFQITNPAGTPSEFWFANAFAEHINMNPPGTILNVADVSLTATPLPAALPLFATGAGLIGIVSWRRKRKMHAALAG